jgi:small GTP-binding protein
MSAGEDEASHKIVFLGDSNTGKTTIIAKYLNLTQPGSTTVAAVSHPLSVTLPNATVKLTCWDTAGQENYRCLVPIYARDAELACLVFDQGNITSFESLDSWLKYLESDVGLTRVLIVANKCDLLPAVPVDHAIEFCALRRLPLVVTSATVGTNISFLFRKVAELIIEDSHKQLPTAQPMRLTVDRRESCC